MKKIAIVTGASSGIGREFALQLDKEEGFDEFWLIARRREKLEQLGSLLSHPARVLPLDLQRPESFTAFQDALAAESPDVRILVNASGFGKFGAYNEISLVDSLGMIDLNSRAPVALTELSLPYMQSGARILQICSIAAFQPLPYLNVYAASKVFLLHYSRALNFELRSRNITVTAVCPGWTRTPFFDVATENGSQTAVTRYIGMRTAEEIVRKGLRQSRRKRDIAVLGLQNNLHRLGAKLVPQKVVMAIFNKIRK